MEQKQLQQRTVRFSDSVMSPSMNESEVISKTDNDDVFKQTESKLELGYKSLRNNYKLIKPYSKYTEENLRPRSPNVQYSELSDELAKKNPQIKSSVFMPTNYKEPSTKRLFNERHCDTYSQHLIRGKSASQPYCFITKEAYNKDVPSEYTASMYGAYPTWGVEDTGFRTRSHYVAEPVARLVNIDVYKRPLTNQPGRIIFDHGRPNNGYYLQRHQYDNTWFNSNLKLNQTDILKSIDPKTKYEYDQIDFERKSELRQATSLWPYCTEYTHKFALNN